MSTSEAVEILIRQVSLDRESSVPLHLQLCRSVQACVTDGRLKAGDRMPVVADLSKLCGVSKGTAMQAVSELKRRQVLVVKRRSGIHVAEVLPRAVEVFFFGVGNRETNVLGDFLQQVLDGLKAGYGDPRRRFMATLVNGHEMSAQGLLAAALARGVDGMVFYRPNPHFASVAAGVARHIPCVSLMRPLPDSAAACVAFAMASPVRNLLQAHLARGVRSFAYVGKLALLRNEIDGPYAPYSALYHSAVETLAEAGIELTLCLAPDRPEMSSSGDLIRRASAMPDGTVVLAQTGTLGAELSRLGKGFQIITYTESRGTLNACRGKATVLYGGLELLGQAAAQVLKERAGSPFLQKPEPVLIEPQAVA